MMVAGVGHLLLKRTKLLDQALLSHASQPSFQGQP